MWRPLSPAGADVSAARDVELLWHGDVSLAAAPNGALLLALA